MKPPRLDHVVIPVRDARASFNFWNEVLGFPLEGALSGDDWGGHPWLMMLFGVGDGRQAVLVSRAGEALGGEGDVRHYAFSVADEAERARWKQRLESAGVAVREEDHGTQRSLYFDDPSGIVLEITAPPSASLTPDANARAKVDAWLARHG